MIVTFENIINNVVNSRTISRKEKQIAVSRFLKEYSGDKKPTSPEEIKIIETLKEVRKTYLLKNKSEK